MILTISSDISVIQVEVNENENIHFVKTFIEKELKIPMHLQLIYFNSKLLDSDLSLKQQGVKENNLLLVMSNSIISTGTNLNYNHTNNSNIPKINRLQDIPTNCSPEKLISIMEMNPQLLIELNHSNPELANALKTKKLTDVRMLLLKQQMSIASKTLEQVDTLKKLEKNPFDITLQSKIEESIRLDNVNTNMEMAMDNIPEVFGSVHMLYIHVNVNNMPLKAFVDSGAQTTIMSSSCAERCGIMRLIDKRFSGQARGVGTAKIVGRVHMAQLKIGQFYYNCSFTILEQQDVDLLFGLDMLRRHQCCIDLRENVLILQESSGAHKVPFLSEHELPKTIKDITEETKSDNINLIAPKEALKIEQSCIQKDQNIKDTEIKESNSSKINHLMSLGFTLEQSTNALNSCNGNIDLAAALLFES